MTMTNGVSTEVVKEKGPNVKAKKSKPKAKKPRAKVKAKSKKKGANFTFRGPGGARERKKLGIHLLIIRVPVAVVKRIDAKLKKKGLKGARGEWCAGVITSASKR